jgi:hypothetical protein
MTSKPIHASSNGQDGLIHHLAWAAVAVTWLVVINDPLTMVANQELNSMQPGSTTPIYQPSEQPALNTAGNPTGSVLRAASVRGDPWLATATDVKLLAPHGHRCLTLEGTIEYISHAQPVPLTEAEMQDLAALLKSL